MENPKMERWELTLSPMGMVHLHYETLLSTILQEGMGGLARELHQVADELTRLGSARETPVPREPARPGSQICPARSPTLHHSET
ncbi:MAG: hypothetical protein WCH75_29430 [Candidatus Binatia bacterium]